MWYVLLQFLGIVALASFVSCLITITALGAWPLLLRNVRYRHAERATHDRTPDRISHRSTDRLADIACNLPGNTVGDRAGDLACYDLPGAQPGAVTLAGAEDAVEDAAHTRDHCTDSAAGWRSCDFSHPFSAVASTISAAGATPEARRRTAAADAELLLLGPEQPLPHALPPLPAGVSPALIAWVVLEQQIGRAHV